MVTYIKLAWYSLKKNPFFSFIILFGISITIMMVMFIGSILDTSYGPNGTYINTDRTLIANNIKVNRIEGHGYSNSSLSYYAYKEYFSKMKSFEVSTITMNHWFSNVYYKNLAKKIKRLDIDEKFTQIYPLEFIKGRPFNFEDLNERRKITIITDKLAKDLFGEEDPLGKKIKTDSEMFEVIGVVKAVNKLRKNAAADIYTPYNIHKKVDTDWHLVLGSSHVFMKFKDKDALIRGQEEYQEVLSSIPIDASKNEVSLESRAMTEKVNIFYNMLDVEDEKMYYVYLYVIVLIIMAIPALSLINLNITRIAERTSEMGIRKAFGASSSDLLKQLLVENVFTTLIGGMMGILFSFIMVYLFNAFSWMGEGETLEINYWLLVFGLSCTLFFSILSGFYPALKVSNFGIINSLKSDKQ
ncbi:ABC transporter permease [Flammeovirga aprica]|uniref:FtsX-like permease family protein n=1 Tax=Flammeovirga aprica JL-4 TaxID=694437 RepID=A0A7X9P1J9_9BACT|nr:ABC transporter permease [Flammeovirga aprica]NME67543.1 FtsX-like permease family protein [Flammeovirga aprica JL-4]